MGLGSANLASALGYNVVHAVSAWAHGERAHTFWRGDSPARFSPPPPTPTARPPARTAF
jgi:hypothetical protein